MTLAEQLRAEGREEGRKEGRVEGRKEGRVEALQARCCNIGGCN
jgi:predicted transposase YdaD